MILCGIVWLVRVSLILLLGFVVCCVVVSWLSFCLLGVGLVLRADACRLLSSWCYVGGLVWVCGFGFGCVIVLFRLVVRHGFGFRFL